MRRLPNRWPDYFLAVVMMSLAWPIRGQFGHFKGALIPGAAAAVIAALLGRAADGLGQDNLWKTLFPRAVIFGSLGFSLGSHFSYGWLIERLLDCHYASALFMDLLRIFAIGGVWGGLGLTFLGFVYSERPFTRSDFLLLAGFTLFSFVFLDFFEQESFVFIVLSAGLLVLHVYNLILKESRMVGMWGLSGILGFGFGFAGAVFLLYLGNNGFLKGPWEWWVLRDQIFGAVGGVAVAWAVRNVCVRDYVPARAALLPAEMRLGFLAYTVFIPGLNAGYVIRHWVLKHGAATSFYFYPVAGILGAILFIALFYFLKKSSLLSSTLFFIWFLSFLAVAKSCFFLGLSHWDIAFTLFPLNALILSILLPFRLKP